MAAINVNDWAFDYINKRMYYDGVEVSPFALVDMLLTNALYSYVMDTFDEQGQMDDVMPMSAQTPTDYTLLNGWFTDEVSMQGLKGGAITTNGWNNEVLIVTFGGTYTNAIPGDIGKDVQDDAASVGPLLSYDNTLKKWWIRDTESHGTIATGSTVQVTVDGGTGTGVTDADSITGESLWTNAYTLGTLEGTPQLYVATGGAGIATTERVSPQFWDTGHIDILYKVREAGTYLGVPSGYATVYARTWTDLYDNFEIDLSPGGRQAVPFATFDDLNNTTASGVVAGYTNVTVGVAGPYSKDIGDGAGVQNYDYSVDGAARPVEEIYEYLKYLTLEGITATIDAVEGQIYTRVVDSSYATVKQAPFGTLAGGIFFGARGIWLENMAGSDAESYQLIDSAGTTRNPPTQAPITVGSVVYDDRVIVAESTGQGLTVIDKAQFTIGGSVASGTAYIEVTEDIPNDTPASGWIRVVDTGLWENRYGFSGWSNTPTPNRFFLTGTTVRAVDTSDTAYVPYIDSAVPSGQTSIVQSLIYANNRYLVARVRKKGILPFETVGELVTGGVTITAIRTTDSIVT